MRHNLKLIISCYRCGIYMDRNSTFKEWNWLCGSSDPIMPIWTSLVTQMVKNLPAMQETQVQSLGWEDPLGKRMAIHSSILAWRIPWTEDLVGYSPWDRKESDMTEWLTLSHTYLPIQFSCSVVSDSLRPMDYSMPGYSVFHYLLEFAQTHVHWVSGAI